MTEGKIKCRLIYNFNSVHMIFVEDVPLADREAVCSGRALTALCTQHQWEDGLKYMLSPPGLLDRDCPSFPYRGDTQFGLGCTSSLF